MVKALATHFFEVDENKYFIKNSVLYLSKFCLRLYKEYSEKQ